MNILIIQTAKLGDMVCTTPLFRAIKQADWHHKLYVAGNAINRELLEGNPNIDHYVVLSKEIPLTQLWLVQNKIDVAICTSPNPSLLWTLLRARVRKIIVPSIYGGFSPYATKTYRLLSLFVTRVPIYFGQYMPLQYLRLLEPLGIHNEDTQKELHYTQQALLKAEVWLPKGKFLVGMAPGVGNAIKQWKVEHFVSVATHLARTYHANIVLFGGPGDTIQTDRMRALLPADVPVINLANMLSLDELKACISRVQLFISVDSGPIYVAETYKVPTINIVGPMDEHEQPPQGEIHINVVPPRRTKPALHIMNARMVDVSEAERQRDSITPEAVIALADVFIAAHRQLFLQ